MVSRHKSRGKKLTFFSWTFDLGFSYTNLNNSQIRSTLLYVYHFCAVCFVVKTSRQGKVLKRIFFKIILNIHYILDFTSNNIFHIVFLRYFLTSITYYCIIYTVYFLDLKIVKWWMESSVILKLRKCLSHI